MNSSVSSIQKARGPSIGCGAMSRGRRAIVGVSRSHELLAPVTPKRTIAVMLTSQRGRRGACIGGARPLLECLESRTLFAGGEPFVEAPLGVNAAISGAALQPDGKVV